MPTLPHHPYAVVVPLLCPCAPAVVAQTVVPLTNLGTSPPRVGLPDDWSLRGARGAPLLLFAVTGDRALRIEATGAAGFAIFELPETRAAGVGTLRRRWRTATPIPTADLRRRATDDSPVRVMIALRDRRTLFYSWGARDSVGAMFPSWTGRTRIVVVARDVRDADGAWRRECHDPFADYVAAFGREAPAIVGVGISADTEQLGAATWAEVAELSWSSATVGAPCEP